MSRSKNRKKQKQHLDYIPHKKIRKSAVPIAITVCAILIFGIAWFAFGRSVIGLIAGALIGGFIGYFAGKEMDKTFSKKDSK